MANYFIQSVFKSYGKCYSRTMVSTSSYAGTHSGVGGKKVLLLWFFPQFSGDTGQEMSILDSRWWQRVEGKSYLCRKVTCKENILAVPLE